MAWRYHNYECSCGHVFECLVDNRDYVPDPCPECEKPGATMLAVGKVNAITSYVPDYPGANIHRAGFADLRKTPDKKGQQVSMHAAPKAKLNAANVPSAPAKALSSSSS